MKLSGMAEKYLDEELAFTWLSRITFALAHRIHACF